MPFPKAYDPQQGYMYQLLFLADGRREYDHLDYAIDKADKKHLMDNYCYRGGPVGGTIKVITLPRKYWKPEEGQVR